MSERTRHLDREELARALAPFAEPDPVAARPIRVARDAAPRSAEPATKLGIGAPRRFPARAALPPVDVRQSQVRVAEARTSLPPPTRVRRRHAISLRRPYAWLAALALAGFALGGLIALTMHATRAPARVPAGVRSPPALPTPLEVTQDAVVTPVVPEAVEPSPNVVGRRGAVDALLAGRNRIALEHYERVLASSTLAERAALEQVVRVLRRELRRCEQEAGTPCGF